MMKRITHIFFLIAEVTTALIIGVVMSAQLMTPDIYQNAGINFFLYKVYDFISELGILIFQIVSIYSLGYLVIDYIKSGY